MWNRPLPCRPQSRHENREYSRSTSKRNTKYNSGRRNGTRHTDFEPSHFLRQLFEKEFTFSLKNLELPPLKAAFSSTPFVVHRLSQFKKKLNEVKDKLDDKDISLWTRHTASMRPTSKVVFTLRETIEPEMCTIAWAKMYEILAKYDLIPKPLIVNDAVRSVHLCEAPGAFVAATNHFIHTKILPSNSLKRQMDWDWVGLSLNPYYEGNDLGAMLDDDRLIVDTANHWWFGPDNTGNIMSQCTIRSLWNHVQQSFTSGGSIPILLVTADGSVDCGLDPNNQESTTSCLHYTEAVCALGLLARGGSFVIKLFTMFEHSTMGILYLLSCVFEKLNVFKPATSKEGNSECYAVCMGFRGIETAYLESLLQRVGDPLLFENVTLFARQSISAEWIEEYISCAEKFSQFQKTVINNNLKTFNTRVDRRYLQQEKNWVSTEWQRRYNPKHLRKELFLVKDVILDGSHRSVGRSAGIESKKRDSGDLESRKSEAKRQRTEINGEILDSKASEERKYDYSSTAKKMMEKMGHQSGQGLGAKNDGIVSPIEPEVLLDRVGLGFASKKHDWTDEPQDWETFENRNKGKWPEGAASNNLIVEGLFVERVSLSKFCPDDLRRELTSYRNALRTMQQTSEKLKEGWEKISPHRFAFWKSRFGELAGEDGYHLATLDDPPFKLLSTLEGQTPETTYAFLDLSLHGADANAQVVCKCIPQAKGFFLHNSQSSAENKEKPMDTSSLSHNLTAWTEEATVQWRGKLDLVLGDFEALNLSEPFGSEATMDEEQRLVREALSALEVLKPGGSLVLAMRDTLKRFQVGLIFLLSLVFEVIWIGKPLTSLQFASGRFVVFRGLRTASHIGIDFLRAHLGHVLERMNQLKEGMETEGCARAVLEVIPCVVYAGTEFFHFVKNRNAFLARREIAALKALINTLQRQD